MSAAGALAGVQYRQAQRGVVAQQVAQFAGADRYAVSLVVGHDQHAVFGFLVKSAMAGKMKNVIRAMAQTFTQGAQAGVGQTLERDLSALLQRSQSLLKPAPFRLNIQLGVPLRAGEA